MNFVLVQQYHVYPSSKVVIIRRKASRLLLSFFVFLFSLFPGGITRRSFQEGEGSGLSPANFAPFLLMKLEEESIKLREGASSARTSAASFKKVMFHLYEHRGFLNKGGPGQLEYRTPSPCPQREFSLSLSFFSRFPSFLFHLM